MTFILLPHGKIREKTKDELRLLMHKWEKMNRQTYLVCAAFLIPQGMVAVIGATLFLMNNFAYLVSAIAGMGAHLKPVSLLPLVLEACLFFFCAMIKGRELKGYAGTLGAYAANTLLLLTFKLYYLPLVVMSIPPALFVVRCLLNYPLLNELKKQPGYPYFIENSNDKYGAELHYLENEVRPVDEEYAPWNAFIEGLEQLFEDEENDENSDGETSSSE